MSDFLFNRIALIGLGLIGSSLAHQIRQKRLAGHLVGFAPSAKTRARARALGLTDSLDEKLEDAVADADLVILCAPPGSFAQITDKIDEHLKAGAILTDVGSFKQKAILDIGAHLRSDVFFVPAHPIAGTERSGPDAGYAELFENRWCIITPLENSDPSYQAAVSKVELFWQQMGSKIAFMEIAHHDRVLALTSHLPHIVAWTLVATSKQVRAIAENEVVSYSGGGFRDFTRLASSNPIMWRDVLLGNRAPVLEMMDRFIEVLHQIRAAIDSEDGEFLEALFTQMREMRSKIVEAGQDTDATNFGRKN